MPERYSKEPEQPNETGNTPIVLNLREETRFPQGKFNGTKPVWCEVTGHRLSVGDKWGDLYVNLIEFLLEHGYLTNEYSYFQDSEPTQRSRRISNGRWVIINLSYDDTVKRIYSLVKESGISFDNICITYQKPVTPEKLPEPVEPVRAPSVGGASLVPSQKRKVRQVRLNRVSTKSFLGTKPVSLQISGKDLPVGTSWRSCLIQVVDFLLRKRLVNKNHKYLQPKEGLENHLFKINGRIYNVCVHGSSDEIVKRRIYTLVKDANIRPSDVVIGYRRVGSTNRTISQNYPPLSLSLSLSNDTNNSVEERSVAGSKISPDIHSEENLLVVDLNRDESLSFTRPRRVLIDERELSRPVSWKDVYLSIVSFLYSRDPERFVAMCLSIGSKRLRYGNRSDAGRMIAPRAVAKDFYIETNYCAHDLVAQIKSLLSFCNISFEDVKIFYENKGKGGSFSQSSPAPIQQEAENDNEIRFSAYKSDIFGSSGDYLHSDASSAPRGDQRINALLKEHYAYGFTPGFVEMRRFRRLASEKDIVLPGNDEFLKQLLADTGVVIGKMIFPAYENMPQELRSMVGDIFATGATVIYYECLWEKQRKWMDSYHVTTPELLKEYLSRYLPNCTFSKNFMGQGGKRAEKEAVPDELRRVWGERQVRPISQLSELLPYVPEETIRCSISGNNLFVRVREGEYLLMDRFYITEEEAAEVLDFVENGIEEDGSLSLSDLPLEGLEIENYELTPSAIANAVYQRVLSDQYQLKGKILAREGQPRLDLAALLKGYLQDKDECTLQEVEQKVVDLTGGPNRQRAFEALYNTMVRVTKDRFVAPRHVHFPVEEVDELIAGFIPDRFRSIIGVTAFTMFPLCGQAWNHYLLESFCHRYSRKYRLCVVNFNDQNAGIIAEKTFRADYDEMLAIELSRTNQELQPDAVLEYLIKNGFLPRKNSRLPEIIKRASKLRSRG